MYLQLVSWAYTLYGTAAQVLGGIMPQLVIDLPLQYRGNHFWAGSALQWFTQAMNGTVGPALPCTTLRLEAVPFKFSGLCFLGSAMQ